MSAFKSWSGLDTAAQQTATVARNHHNQMMRDLRRTQMTALDATALEGGAGVEAAAPKGGVRVEAGAEVAPREWNQLVAVHSKDDFANPEVGIIPVA